MSCQTTHQLQRLTELQRGTNSPPVVSAPSGLFDWLICPPESTIDLLEKRIPDFTKSSIHIHKERPYWTEFNLYFWHNFLVTGQGERYIDIDATFDKEITRWRYLRDRFAALDPAHTVFVISNTQNNLETEVFDESERDQYHFTKAGMDALCRSLADYFRTKKDNIHLEIVTRPELSQGLETTGRVNFLPPDQNQWKGSKQSWNNWWQQQLKSY